MGKVPVWYLRFQQDVPPTPWQQVTRAWDYGLRCAQFVVFKGRIFGEEDFIFWTNIRSRLSLAVSFAIRGLQFGSGQINFLKSWINKMRFGFQSIVDWMFQHQSSSEKFVIRSGWQHTHEQRAIGVHSLVISNLVQGLLHKANSGLFSF